MNTIILALGSNKSYEYENILLSPYELLQKACSLLGEKVLKIEKSSIFNTKPMYVEDQENFYNMVISCEYEGENPTDLLDFTQTIEKKLGRDRSKEFRNGPRSMDIDIVLFGDKAIKTDRLEIPHPRLEERAFVLVPMLEVLEKNADTYMGYYKSCLEKLDRSDVELFTP